jgi:hypothetical protein
MEHNHRHPRNLYAAINHPSINQTLNLSPSLSLSRSVFPNQHIGTQNSISLPLHFCAEREKKFRIFFIKFTELCIEIFHFNFVCHTERQTFKDSPPSSSYQ